MSGPLTREVSQHLPDSSLPGFRSLSPYTVIVRGAMCCVLYLLQGSDCTALYYIELYYTALPRKMTIGLALEFKRTINVRNLFPVKDPVVRRAVIQG